MHLLMLSTPSCLSLAHVVIVTISPCPDCCRSHVACFVRCCFCCRPALLWFILMVRVVTLLALVASSLLAYNLCFE